MQRGLESFDRFGEFSLPKDPLAVTTCGLHGLCGHWRRAFDQCNRAEHFAGLWREMQTVATVEKASPNIHSQHVHTL